jgi:hypothetical protein
MSNVKFRRDILRRALWILACKHDGIEVDAKFACFSAGNPWPRKFTYFSDPGFDCFGFVSARGKLIEKETHEEKS